MAAVNKDFKVKNGIQVAGDAAIAGDAIIVGTVSAATPTIPEHLATKAYVDALAGGIPVSANPPENPDNGDLWFDTLTQRVNVHYESQWLTIATIDDTLNIPDHIHDTSIDGNGLIAVRFVDAGSFDAPQGTPISGGDAETTNWSDTYDGGVAVDNYN